MVNEIAQKHVLTDGNIDHKCIPCRDYTHIAFDSPDGWIVFHVTETPQLNLRNNITVSISDSCLERIARSVVEVIFGCNLSVLSPGIEDLEPIESVPRTIRSEFPVDRNQPKITARLPPELHSKVCEIKKATSKTFQMIVEEALEFYCNNALEEKHEQ